MIVIAFDIYFPQFIALYINTSKLGSVWKDKINKLENPNSRQNNACKSTHLHTYTLRINPLCFLTKMAMLGMWNILAKAN